MYLRILHLVCFQTTVSHDQLSTMHFSFCLLWDPIPLHSPLPPCLNMFLPLDVILSLFFLGRLGYLCFLTCGHFFVFWSKYFTEVSVEEKPLVTSIMLNPRALFNFNISFSFALLKTAVHFHVFYLSIFFFCVLFLF